MSGIMRSFEDWIGSQVRERGVIPLVALPCAAAAALITSGLAADIKLIQGIGFVVLTVQFIILALYFMLRILSLRRLAHERGDLLSRYTNKLMEANNEGHVVNLWQEEIDIDRSGDASVSRILTITVTDGSLDVIEQTMTQFWSEGLSRRERSLVQVRARRINGFTDGKPQLGARLDVTTNWQTSDGANRHCVQVHLGQPVKAEESVSLQVSWRWPKHYRALNQVRYEDFTWSMRRNTDEVKTRVKVAPAVHHNVKPAASKIGNAPEPTITQDSKSAWIIEQECTNPNSKTDFGYRLDLTAE